MQLFPSVRLYHPTFVYGLIALFLQAGVLQAIGCLGAVRMNERLLNLYYNILVALMFGDAIVGVVWLFRYDFIVTNLKSDLKSRLSHDYGLQAPFQDLWDRIQREHQCCGVDGPIDYNLTSWFERNQAKFPNSGQLVPYSCCRPEADSDVGLPFASHQLLPTSGPGSSHSHDPAHMRHHKHEHHRRHTRHDFICTLTTAHEAIWQVGCYGPIMGWFQKSVDILSVIGFCVLSFLKVCFACILKYEIQEMIQKIQVLKGAETDLKGATPLHELEAYLPRPSIANEGSTSLMGATGPGAAFSTSVASGCTIPGGGPSSGGGLGGHLGFSSYQGSPQSGRCMLMHDSTPTFTAHRNSRPIIDPRDGFRHGLDSPLMALSAHRRQSCAPSITPSSIASCHGASGKLAANGDNSTVPIKMATATVAK
ncbi:Tetraspanin-14 [Halotydeus destructor]|nr:Tetraspanin-14 [Halotydeus destructor]